MTTITNTEPSTHPGPRTATVETLTATVRVLQVGSRQITLSVARQLDTCELEEMEPFGRVRLGTKDDDHHAIGKRHSDGSLVIATYRAHRGVPWVSADDLTKTVTVCGACPHSAHEYTVLFDGRPLEIETSAVTECGLHYMFAGAQDRCDVWTANGQEAAIRAVVQAEDDIYEPHRLAAELPLVVLAGLK